MQMRIQACSRRGVGVCDGAKIGASEAPGRKIGHQRNKQARPRLLNPDAIRETIARGVESGVLDVLLRLLSSKNKHVVGHLDISRAQGGPASALANICEPPKLTSVLVDPDELHVEPPTSQTFMAKGLDQHGRHLPNGQVQWKATGGTIDQDGVFVAGKNEGSFVLTASIASAAQRGSDRGCRETRQTETTKRGRIKAGSLQ